MFEREDNKKVNGNGTQTKEDPRSKIDYRALGLPPNDLHMYKGEELAVNVGKKNVPKSMPTEYDQAYIQQAQQNAVLDYGEDHDAMMKIRKELMKMKNVLKKICPPHEAMLRHKLTFKEKANPENPKHVANLEKKLKVEKAKVAGVLEALSLLDIKNSEKYIDTHSTMADHLTEVIKGATAEYESKEDYFKYQTVVKKCQNFIFKEMQNLLKKIKAIKKSAQSQSQKSQEPKPESLEQQPKSE